jgi:hypothetical protein
LRGRIRLIGGMIVVLVMLIGEQTAVLAITFQPDPPV